MRVGRAIRGVIFILVAFSLLASAASSGAGAKRHKRHHPAHKRHHPPRPPAVCANADVPATAASADQMRSAVVCLIDVQRTRRHLPALTASPQLNRSAQGWTEVMVATGNFTHGPGNAFAARISAAGYDWRSAGENIATGYPTPRSVVAAWMASTDHCHNILDPSFRNVGTGVSPRSVGLFSSGPSTWTQDFGLLQGQSPLSGNHGPQNGCPYR